MLWYSIYMEYTYIFCFCFIYMFNLINGKVNAVDKSVLKIMAMMTLII